MMRRRSPEEDLRRAARQAIQARTEYPVYDEVPEHTPFPYIEFGGCSITPWDTKVISGWEVTLTIHGWTTYKGSKEPARIGSEIVSALSPWRVPMEGDWAVVDARPSLVETLRETDGELRHTVVRFVWKLQDLTK